MVDKRCAAAMFETIARLLTLEGANVFRIRAFEEASRAVESLAGDFTEEVESGRILNVKGIGKALQGDLAAFIKTGSMPIFERLVAQYPISLLDLLRLPGLGPKKVKILYQDLGIVSIDDLATAVDAGRLASVAGFGAKTQEQLLRKIAFYRANLGKYRYPDVIGELQELVAKISALPEVVRCELAGPLRRRFEVTESCELLVATQSGELPSGITPLIGATISLNGGGGEFLHGKLAVGLPLEIRAIGNRDFAHALLLLTGSREHLALLAGRARHFDLSLDPDGLKAAGGVKLECLAESDLYAALGLPWIPPELREGNSEISLAEQNLLPTLVSEQDIKGVFHSHTTASDGKASLDEMVLAAEHLGLQYLGISDHSKAAAYAGGLDEGRLRSQHAEIEILNHRLKDFRIFKGVEADILKDGTVDLAPEALAACDFVIASIHSRHGENREQMTNRICRAIANPLVTMLGHISGRLLLEREPYELDYDRIFETAAKHETLIEINADPLRMELDWRYLPRAKNAGVVFSINPDAHSTGAIAYTSFGVGVARKGGLGPQDIFNTRSTHAVATFLRNRKSLLSGCQ